MRYLTLWPWKADKRSLKSWYILSRALHRVSGKGDFNDCSHPFMHGSALPIPIFVRFHFLVAGVDADGLVHALFLARAGLLFNPRYQPDRASGYPSSRAIIIKATPAIPSARQTAASTSRIAMYPGMGDKAAGSGTTGRFPAICPAGSPASTCLK